MTVPKNSLALRCRRLALFATASALVVLAGCASTGQVAKSVVDANLAQEMANNQLVLLNIARAAERRPMHFTRLSTVRLPIGLGNPSFDLPISFGADRSHLYTLTSHLGITQGVDTTVQDSQDFMEGITTPVPATLFQYYLEQGWPQSIILHMFVHVMEIYRKEPGKIEPQLVGRIENYPPDSTKMMAFQKAVENMSGCAFRFETVKSSVPYGPILDGESLKDLRAMAALHTANIGVVPVDSTGSVTDSKAITKYRLAKESKDTELRVSRKLGMECRGVTAAVSDESSASSHDAISAPAPAAAALGFAPLFIGKASLNHSALALNPSSSSKTGTTTQFVTLTLRSPEAMLYYLGEIARTQLQAQRDGDPVRAVAPLMGRDGWRATTPSTAHRALFRVFPTADTSAAVSVEYLGATYALPPSSDSDSTMHTLSLIIQILSLQNKGSATPVTSNIRLVN